MTWVKKILPLGILAAFFCPRPASAEALFLKPGDNGEFSFTVVNSSDSVGPLPTPQVIYPNKPEWFSLNNVSVIPYDELKPGTSCEVIVGYTIGIDAPGVTTDLNLKVSLASNVYPPVWYPAGGGDKKIVVDNTPPVLSIAQPKWLNYPNSANVIPTDAGLKVVRGAGASFYAADPESGIADFQISNSSQENIAAEYFTQESGGVSYSGSFPEDLYSVTTLNKAGLSTTGKLYIDYTPAVEISSFTEVEVSSGSYLDSYAITAKSHWGLGMIKLLPATFSVTDLLSTAVFDSALAIREYNGNGVSSAAFTFQDVPDGEYVLCAKNSLGSLSASPATIHSSTTLNTETGMYDHAVQYVNPDSSLYDDSVTLNFNDNEKLVFHISYDSVAFKGMTFVSSVHAELPSEITNSYFAFPYGLGFTPKTSTAFFGNMSVRVDYRSAPFTQTQQENARLYTFDGSEWVNITSEAGSGWVKGTASSLSKMVLVFPYPAQPLYVANSFELVDGIAEVELSSYFSGASLSATTTEQSPVSEYVSSAAALGQYLVSDVFAFGGNIAELVPAGVLKFRFSARQLLRYGVSDKTLSLNCAFEGVLRTMSDAVANGESITVNVNAVPQVCGIFSTTKPVVPDLVAPESAIQYSGSFFTRENGETYLGPDAGIGINSYDSAQNGVAVSRVGTVYYGADVPSNSIAAVVTGDFSGFIVYNSTFNLVEGTHTVTYFAADNAGNVELPKQAVIHIDYSAPETYIYSEENQPMLDGILYTSGAGLIDLDSSDPEYSGVASGVKITRTLLDVNRDDCPSDLQPDSAQPFGTCANNAYKTPLALSAGAHSLHFWAEDNVGNIEYENLQDIFVDTVAPYASVYVNGVLAEGSALPMAEGSTITLTASDPADLGDASGVKTISLLIDTKGSDCTETPTYTAVQGTCDNPVYSAPFTLSPGTHTVSYFSTDNVGNNETVKKLGINQTLDITPPDATLSVGGNAVSDGATAYILLADSVAITATDPVVDGVASGVMAVYFLKDVNPETCDGTRVSTAPEGTCQNYVYTTPFTLGVGTHTVYYSAADNVGNKLPLKIVHLIVAGAPDTIAPITSLFINNVAVSTGAVEYVRPSSTLTLVAVDPMVQGAERSGVALTTYTVVMLIDQNWVPVESDTYTEPMVVKGEGSYKFYYQSVDAAGNWEALNNRIINIDKTAPVAEVQVYGSSTTDAQGNLVVSADQYISIVSTDPVSNGVASGIKDNFFQVDVSPESCEQEPTFTGPAGTCQNPRFTTPFTLAVGTHTVYYTAVDNVGNMAEIKRLFFTVSAPSQTLLPISPSSGSIGVPFTITGADFGTYSAGVTAVLVGGAAAPLTLWSTSTIKGTIPGTLPAGEQTVAVMRGTSTIANAAPFTVNTPALYALSPSSGAIGLPFTLTGENFGNYVANFTQVLLGGATMPLTLWTDSKIQGTIPGNLVPGEYALVVERALNGGVVRSSSATFTLSNMQAFWLAPSSGPIGMPFTITGEGFGNYSAAYEHVLLGDTTAPLTLWTDNKIQGTVPGSLASGQYPVVVERRTPDGGLMQTSPKTFEVVTVDVASMTPVTGPIGLPFTIYGANFGNYVANLTRVLIGGTTAPLSLWTSTQIQGTIPGSLAAGEYPVVVERELNSGIVRSTAMAFVVTTPAAFNIMPSSGAIGVPFTINGANFGNYSAAYMGVLINGATVPLTLWTDTKIQGTIPGNLAAGQYPIKVARGTADGGLVKTSALTFEVLGISVASITPVAGPIGLPFTIYGGNFGNYSAGYTKVLIGGTTAPLTLWSDTKIQGTIPGSLAAGDYELLVERTLNGGVVRSLTSTFTVTVPVLEAIEPSTAAVIAPFTITGASFGNYVANSTKVLINGATMPLTLWTDTKIQGKLPFLLNGTYPVQVQRSFNGGLAESATAYITVAEPVISSMTPASGAVGTVFNLYGSSFGPYDATQTRVTIGGVACALSLWTDTNIRGTVPSAMSYGAYTVVAMRGQTLSNEIEYTVLEPFRVSMARPVTMLDAEFKLGEVYVYPNPAKGGKVPVFHVEVGLADSVKLKVFTVAGQSVLERTLTGVPQAIDGKYAYEYAWEGHIASGVYYYTMEAERAGKKLKAKGKFAVVR